jgi:hypothetical protein
LSIHIVVQPHAAAPGMLLLLLRSMLLILLAFPTAAPPPPVGQKRAGKHIDWYVGHSWNWLTANVSGINTDYEAALAFALSTHADLVDGMFPSFVHLNCSTGSLPAGLDFSAYTPFIGAGIQVSPTFEGDPSCCALGGSCPLFANREALAQQLLTLALRYNLSGYTQDWEFTSSFNHTGYNDTMAHIASVLLPHGLGLGNSISSSCELRGLNGGTCANLYNPC